MCKFKYKFKKIIYKVIPCIIILSLIFSFTLFPSADTVTPGTVIIHNLDEIFDETTGDFLYAIADNQSQPLGLSKNSGYFRSVNTMPARVVNLYGQIHPLYDYADDMYYKITIPLSYNQTLSSVATLSLSLVDYSGVVYDFEVQPFRPDPKNAGYVTFVFTGTFSGSVLNNAKRFHLSCRSQSWEGFTPAYAYIGLLEGRTAQISSMSAYEYNVLYGGNNKPISPDSENQIASYVSYEEQLFEHSNISGAISFFENLENFDLTEPITSASMLFSELYNFGGTRTTIFETIAMVSLAFGLVVALFAIAPRLVSGGGKKK